MKSKSAIFFNLTLFIGLVVLNYSLVNRSESQATRPAVENNVLAEQFPAAENLLVDSSPTPTPLSSLAPTNDQTQSFRVVKVIDGDTIKLENGQIVRYIGIDTPETSHPSQGQECFGPEATLKNEELVLGKNVRLEKDVSETDRYGRLLRYVWINHTLINDILIRQGYAQASAYPPDVQYQDRFEQAETEARQAQSGFWADNACPPNSDTDSEQSYNQSVQKPTEDICVCATNTYNCTDFTTHSEAQTCFDACGGLTNDVHRLDRDQDGVVCESLP